MTCNPLVEDHNVLHQVELHLVALSFELLDARTGFWFLWTFPTGRHCHVWHWGILARRRLIVLLTLILLILDLSGESVRLAWSYTCAHAASWCLHWLLLWCEIGDGRMRATVRTFFPLSHALSFCGHLLIRHLCLTSCSSRCFVFLCLDLLLLHCLTLEGWNDSLTARKRRRHEILGLISRLIDFPFECVHWMEHLFVIVSGHNILCVHSLRHWLKASIHVCIELTGFGSVLAKLLHHVLFPPFVQLRFKCV